MNGPLPERIEPVFAHASEAEMARILDFYAVRWEYEPHTFPILWTIDGDVAESFSPDFFLPDLDLYLEMTTLRQKLVRKKNRKLRRLRELYPGMNVKLFYARDFRALMLKYGKVALADGLSGTAGQPRPRLAVSVEIPLDIDAVAAVITGSPDPLIDLVGLAPPSTEVGTPSTAVLTTPAIPGGAARRRSRRRRRSAAAELREQAVSASAAVPIVPPDERR